MTGAVEKPVIAAVNGFAMGGGFMLVERTDLRVAVREAVFEVSEAKRWLLGGYNHGHIANLPYPVAMEMALGFRFTAQRFYEVGFLNRLVPADRLMPEAIAMAEHLLTLPPASRVNTVHMMRQMRPAPAPEMKRLADALHEGRLFAAGLDVFEREPEVHPRLLSAPRTVLLPHIGSASQATRTRMAALASSAVATVLNGGMPPNVVPS